MNTTTCRYYRSGAEADLSLVLHRESVRRGPGAPPWPVLERLDVSGLWLPVDAESAGRDGFVPLDGLEPIDAEQAAALYLWLGELRLIPPTTPLPLDLAVAAGIDTGEGRAVPAWLVVPLLLSGTLLVALAVLTLLVFLAFAIF